jgi:hypothetical protein
MGKTWVLDTETKGTGANMVPLDKAQQKADEPARRPARMADAAPRPGEAGQTPKRGQARASARPRRTATPLPPGHVRKKTTGEIGKVRSVDPKAGTAVVQWLKRGHTSTVPLSAVARR